jgi:anaerobic magnesium-protoporphyrin IX monomethyl ester cyclase
MDYAPYEILGNNVLSFADIIKIKQVEDVMEKFWNDHRMDTTMEFLVAKAFPTPFDFFQEFGIFWDSQGWAKIGHQLEDLFRRLHDFLIASAINDLDCVVGLMKYDYLRNHKFKPRKPWWEASFEKKRRNNLYQLILDNPSLPGSDFANLKLDEKELYKHTMLEEIPFDMDHFLNTGEMVRGSYCLLAYFEPSNNHTSLFTFEYAEKPVE